MKQKQKDFKSFRTSIGEVKCASLDAIQITVSVPLETIQRIDYSWSTIQGKLKTVNYTLNTLSKNIKPMMSILRNQIEILKLGESIFPVCRRTKKTETTESYYPTDNSDEQEFECEIDNQSVLIDIDINVKRFLLDIVNLPSNLNRLDIYQDFDGPNGTKIHKPNSLLVYYFNEIYNEDTRLFRKYYHKIAMENDSIYYRLVNNQFINKFSEGGSLHRYSVDIAYQAIIYYITIIFSLLTIRINYIRIADVFISSNLIDRLRDCNKYPQFTMDIVNAVLDYTQCATDVIRGMVEYNEKSNLADTLAKIYTSYHKGFVPLESNLESDIPSEITKGIKYRGIIKPHGEEYLDGGFSVFSYDPSIKKLERYFPEKTKGTIRSRTYGKYLDPVYYYKEFGDKFSWLSSDEAPSYKTDRHNIFAMTFKPYSIREIEEENKAFVKYKKTDDLYIPVQEVNYFVRRYATPYKDIMGTLAQLYGVDRLVNQYLERAQSNRTTYHGLNDLCIFIMDRFLLDPVYLLLHKVKYRKILQEITFKRFLMYFVTSHEGTNNHVRDVLSQIDTIYSRCFDLKLISNSYEDYTTITRLNDNKDLKTVKEAFDLINAKGNLLFVDKVSLLAFCSLMINNVFYHMPKNIVLLKNPAFIEYIAKEIIKLFSVEIEDLISLNRTMYRKILKDLNRIAAAFLVRKNYIDIIEYTEKLSSSTLNLYSVAKDRTSNTDEILDNVFDPTEFESSILIFLGIFKESLETKPYHTIWDN